ncbi:endonuclease/exonuclease/phosphatase family protein [Tenacibaculum sp.]|uniref:endonuclease/exonuclease/phosphatase family protein n=1 Tax=Tenacibaculum sp. TaxID=1906242 RepID=UPI003D0A825A
MSYNISHGEGIDSVLDLSRSAKIIELLAPDLCGLQEVDNHCSRSNNIGQTDYLANRTKMKGTFGKFMNFQKGQYGMATLSAKPIISTEIFKLPKGKYEPRSSIIHKVQIEEDYVILFINVHFDWVDGSEGIKNRLKQAKALIKHIDKLGLPCIIAGDFNCTPNSPTMQYFRKQGFSFVNKGKDNLSFQGVNKTEIDHVIYKNTSTVNFKPQKTLLLDEPIVSDHRPLVVELEVTLN